MFMPIDCVAWVLCTDIPRSCVVSVLCVYDDFAQFSHPYKHDCHSDCTVHNRQEQIMDVFALPHGFLPIYFWSFRKEKTIFHDGE